MRAAILFIAAASAAFAQIDNNVITVTASRTLNVVSDQVQVAIVVTTDTGATVDAVVAALPGGISATNLASVTQSGEAGLQWTFTETVVVQDLTGTITAINAAGAQSKFTIGYFVQGANTAQQPECPYPALIGDARAQAAQVAAAAGVMLGPIVSLTQGSGVAAARIFNPLTGFLLSGILTQSYVSTSPSSCSLTVQFQISQ